MIAIKDDMPGCSVIIAAWNAEDFIVKSVRSALAQERVDVEIIVINDASPDRTKEVVETSFAEDDRVRLIDMPCNSGPSAARNTGIAAASRPWVAVLDSDDEMSPDRLQEMISMATHTGADVVFDLFREQDQDSNIISQGLPIDIPAAEQWDLARWILDNRPGIGFCTGYLKPVMRQEFLMASGISYHEEIRNSEDYLLIEDILIAGGSVWVSPFAGYLYTRRAGSLSHRRDAAQLEALVHLGEAARTRIGSEGRARRALEARLDALRNMLALTRFIEGLQQRAPAQALRAWWGRPQSTRLLISWLGEVLGKRIRGRS